MLFDFYFLFSLSLLSYCGAIQHTTETSGWKLKFKYHTHEELTDYIRELVHYFPDLVSLYSIGRSVEQKELWVLKITSPSSAILGTPNVKFIGNIHGNEPAGRELLLHFAEYLVVNYQKDEEVRWLLNSTIIHILPSINPDGFAKSTEGECMAGPGRENSAFVDLNRSFPDHFHTNHIPVQPETRAIMEWLSKIQFVLSAGLHGGALVANYPFENSPGVNTYELSSGEPSLSPDDDVFKYLARTYANYHRTMHRGEPCRPDLPLFPGGITNGAEWYPLTGGMQDYNYIWHGCMELTLEISCCKYPSSKHLSRIWNDNKYALLELAKQAQRGVRGVVMDAVTGNAISKAILRISGRNVSFTSAVSGEFWRILLPGTYTLEAEAKNYYNQKFPFIVRNTNRLYPTSTWLNVYLKPIGKADLYHPSKSNKAAGFHLWISCLWMFVFFNIK